MRVRRIVTPHRLLRLWHREILNVDMVYDIREHLEAALGGVSANYSRVSLFHGHGRLLPKSIGILQSQAVHSLIERHSSKDYQV